MILFCGRVPLTVQGIHLSGTLTPSCRADDRVDVEGQATGPDALSGTFRMQNSRIPPYDNAVYAFDTGRSPFVLTRVR